MCKADAVARSFHADLRIGLERAFAPPLAGVGIDHRVPKPLLSQPDDAGRGGFAGDQAVNSEKAR